MIITIKLLKMKKQLILNVALFVTIFSFAQKKELKMLEKAVKNNNYSEAKAFVSKLETMESSMDDKMKAKYYLNRGKAFYANGTGSNEDILKSAEALSNLQSLGQTKGLSEFKKQMENEILTKANNLYQEKKYKEAALNFINLYKILPNDQTYLYYAASSSISAKEYDMSLKLYLELKELGYTGVETEYVAVNKATGKEEVMLKQQRDLYVKAGTHINPSERKTKSKKGEITRNIALIYVNQGKADEAIAAIQEARLANPKDTALLMSEANMHYKAGNIEAYEALIKEAVENDPNNVELLFNLGVLSTDAGKIAEAKAYYEKAIKIDPNYVNALTNLASLILGEEAAIIEEMNGLGSSAADDKRYDELKESRSQIYKTAIPYLETVLKVDENNIDVAKTLLNIFSAIGEDDKFKAIKEKYKL